MSALLTRRRVAPLLAVAPPVDDIHVMPTGNLPGYRLVWSDNFDYNYPIGSITPTNGNLTKGPAAAELGSKIGFYDDGWRTTHDGKVYPILSTEPGYLPPKADGTAGAYHPAVVSKYFPSKTVEFANGSLRVRQHTELINGVATALGCVFKPKLASGAYLLGPYGRWRFRSRHVEVISGETGVDLAAAGDFTSGKANNWHYVPLGIDSDNWPSNGELDTPEGETNRRMQGNHHPAAAKDSPVHWEVSPAASPYDWHVWDIEWTPTMVRYRMDGVVVFTSTTQIPSGGLAVLSQHEANWRQPTGSSVTETDWWCIWEYDPNEPGTPAVTTPTTPTTTPTAAAPVYLQRSGSTLTENGKTWRGNGANWHWAGMKESAVKAGAANVYPTHAEIDEVLADAAAQGLGWIRAHTLGISAGLTQSLVTGVNADASLVWNTAAWEPIDYAISRARALKIRLVIPMTDQHNYYHLGKAWWVRQAFLQRATSGIPSSYTYAGAPGGTETGVTSYAMPAANTGFSGSSRAKKIEQQFYALPWLRTAFITNYTGGWLDHVNQFTGVANKAEPMVAFLSAGNELWDSGTAFEDHAGADGVAFAKAFSALVKSKQPGIMVVDPMGSWGGDPSKAPGAADTNTDVIDEDHLYPGGQDVPAGQVEAKTGKVAALGKVAMILEYSITIPNIEAVLASIEQTAACAGAGYWAIYSPSEGHSSGGPDDSVYAVGGNGSWRQRMQQHSAVMSSGTVPAAPVLTNLLRSSAAANSEAPASTYAAGAVGSSVPVVAIASGQGVAGAAVQLTATGSDHKWGYIGDLAAAAPVTPGQTYTATAHAKVASGALSSGFSGHLTWFNSAGGYISGATSTSPVTATGTYAQVAFSGVAPAGAAFAVPQVEFDGPASGTAVVLVDQWGVFAGTNASPWVSP